MTEESFSLLTEDENRIRMQLLRKQERREQKPKQIFYDAIDDARKELEEGLDFLKRAEEEPFVLFLEAERYLRSTRGMVYTIMNHMNEPHEAIKGHDFQVYLSHLANQAFQTWLMIKGSKRKFTIEVRNPHHFPSIFAVYHEDLEILQFDLIEKWYGVRDRPMPKEDIIQIHEKQLRFLDAEIQAQKKQLNEAIKRRDHPLLYYKGIRNFFSYLILNKKKIYHAFHRFVEREERHLKSLMKEKEHLVQWFPQYLQRMEDLRESIETIEPFFQELGYKLMKEKSRLY